MPGTRLSAASRVNPTCEFKFFTRHARSIGWSLRSSECPGIASSIDQEILPGDKTGVLRAEKCAVSAELVRPTVAFGGIGLGARAPELLECFAARLHQCADVRPLCAAIEDSRQE